MKSVDAKFKLSAVARCIITVIYIVYQWHLRPVSCEHPYFRTPTFAGVHETVVNCKVSTWRSFSQTPRGSVSNRHFLFTMLAPYAHLWIRIQTSMLRIGTSMLMYWYSSEKYWHQLYWCQCLDKMCGVGRMLWHLRQQWPRQILDCTIAMHII